jgi:anti-sigma factor ChrR (cupin superfamily)
MYHLSPNPELAKSLHEGALQFAGSEASSTFPGFLEGAVEAGENAAAGAIAVLKKKAADLEKLRKQGQKWVSINSDKTQNYLVNVSDVKGSAAGNVSNVQRVIYERLGGEVARATSKVTFQPNTTFPEHAHDGGEEFVVLNGVWRDRWGAFPKYSYVRNYIGSRHSPQIGAEGVEIMVKLRQMTHAHKEPENTGVSFAPPVGVEEGVTSVDGWELVNVKELTYEDAKVFDGANSGPESNFKPTRESITGRLWRKPLFESPFEKVFAEYLEPGTSVEDMTPPGSQETLVVEGSYSDFLGEHDLHAWARYGKDGENRRRIAGEEGCLLYVKQGHRDMPEVGV